jgi:hypothetical protein
MYSSRKKRSVLSTGFEIVQFRRCCLQEFRSEHYLSSSISFSKMLSAESYWDQLPNPTFIGLVQKLDRIARHGCAGMNDDDLVASDFVPTDLAPDLNVAASPAIRPEFVNSVICCGRSATKSARPTPCANSRRFR